MSAANFTQRGGAMAARVAHNHEVGGSNPPPATKFKSVRRKQKIIVFSVFRFMFLVFMVYEVKSNHIFRVLIFCELPV